MADNFQLTLDGPYGVVPISLAKSLYNNSDFKQLVFAIYIDARRKCKDGKWEFNTADIVHETGIDRRLVSKLCQGFVDAGILSAAGETPKGAGKFRVNHRKFERYLNGKVPVKSRNVVCIECTPPGAHQSAERPVNSSCSEKAATDQVVAWCASDARKVFMPCAFGVHSMDTKISEKISEEDKASPKATPNEGKLVAEKVTKEELRRLLYQQLNKLGDGKQPRPGYPTALAPSADRSPSSTCTVSPSASAVALQAPSVAPVAGTPFSAASMVEVKNDKGGQ